MRLQSKAWRKFCRACLGFPLQRPSGKTYESYAIALLVLDFLVGHIYVHIPLKNETAYS